MDGVSEAPSHTKEIHMLRRSALLAPLAGAFATTALGRSAQAQAQAQAQARSDALAGFRTLSVDRPDGARIHARVGGSGPLVVLIHGFTQTGDMWAPVALELARDHTVLVPDLRGLGASVPRPEAGYDKRTQAGDVRAVVQAAGHDRARAVVGHDIGLMVAYAYAAQFPDATERLALLEAPLPGIAPWEEILKNPRVWHFGFHGPHAERLVAGRERIYLDRFWDEFAADPSKLTEADRARWTLAYAAPGAMRAGFANFAAFAQDASDNEAFARRRLAMPVLAVGGERSFGPAVGAIAANVAADVRAVVIPAAGHWLVEEQPEATIRALRQFIDAAG
jgi:pimeloyl-ACP methyl ester carboxylesterase